MNWIRKLLGKEGEGSPPILSDAGEVPFIPDADQVRRKHWAETILEKQGIPINLHLPMIESEQETTIRSAPEIVGRLLALCAVAGIATDENRKAVEEFARDKGAEANFTAMESKFFADPKPAMRDHIQFSWQYEGAWVLLWALNLCDETLSFTGATCDVQRIIDVVCTSDDLATKSVRSKSEILDQADLIYRYHWAVRQAGLEGKGDPGGLDGGVVLERHRALNWLVGYNDEDDWDEVTTDT
jgi:Domain of unknown function (DUF4272)